MWHLPTAVDALRFTTEDGVTLVGELRAAEGDRRGGAVLAHPHPRHGGSKDHPLLWAIRNELAGKRGVSVLSFNFRGVMGSEGTFGGGEGEVLDLGAALGELERRSEPPTLVVGWSFGARVALARAVSDPRVGALALLGLSLSEPRFRLPDLPNRSQIRGLDLPVLLLSGEADQFSPAPELRMLGRRLPRGEVVVVENAGHFFDRREREIAEIVGSFAERALSR